MKLKKLLAVVLTAILLMPCAALLGVNAAGANEIYVAPDGSDAGDGSISSPFATLDAAKNAAKSMSGDVVVYLRGGSYTLDETLNFTTDDKANVTFKGYDGEKAVLTSGTPYTGFEECTVNGVKALRKDVGKGADFNALFNEETTLPRTRYPDSGYFYVKKVNDKDIVNPEVTENVHRGYGAMYVEKGDVKDFKNINDVMVRILHYWKDEMVTVKSYDSGSGYMQFSRGTSMQVQPDDRYFLENVFEALDEPGEWYLDKPAGVLYYVPFAGEDAKTLTLWGSETETMVSVNGVDGICFENIVFRGNGFNVPHNNEGRDSSQAAYDASQCVVYHNANDFHIKNCEFRDIAGGAVYLGRAVKNAVVDSNVFENLGAQAVFVEGYNIPLDDERVTKNIDITNNLVSGYGKIFYNAVGILVIHANTVNVSHNEIHDGYYTAISVGWVWGYSYTVTSNNRVCDNLIYNIGQGWLSDMGGIYMLGNQPGTVLSGNVIHNVAADPGQGGYGGWGIYLDEGSSYMLVEKNLVYACGNDSYHLHYGSYNTVTNNIFALSGESQIRVVSAPKRCTPPDGGKETANFTKNIILTDDKVRAFSYMTDTECFSENGNIFWDLTNGAEIYASVGSDAKDSLPLEKAEKKGYINDPVVVDPMFKDAANFDFELDENSPVFKAGFEAFDYSNAGTLDGTTVGLSFEGGSTPYNAESSLQNTTSSKYALGWLEKIGQILLTLIYALLSVFGL